MALGMGTVRVNGRLIRGRGVECSGFGYPEKEEQKRERVETSRDGLVDLEFYL
jgi:hypothetical protein